MSIIQAIILAIVEGLTEFLPISSTGHMIIVSSLMGIAKEDFTKVFEVAVQLGAIMAVVVLYWKKFFQFDKWEFYVKLMVGVLPVLLFGYLFNDLIDKMLGSPVVVACSLLFGGIVLVFIDRIFKQPLNKPNDIFATEVTQSELIEADDKLTFKKSLMIGLWQIISMIPGVSRSAASIIGGMHQKLTRNFAAEFSFFLAVPTMFAATGYTLFLKNWGTEEAKIRGYELLTSSSENMIALIIGNVVAFIVAIIAIKTFISLLTKYGFKFFGYYRILAGLLVLILIQLGIIS